MEADWEIEIGPSAPVLEGRWDGFVDLREHPGGASNQVRTLIRKRVQHLPEVEQFPAMAEALVRLNGFPSPVWTSKCDVWQLPGTIDLDPDEMNAQPEETASAWACYIDLLPTSDQQWGHRWEGSPRVPTMAMQWCKAICARLRSMPLRCCRADLVIRLASIAPEQMDIGVTAYVTACGSTSDHAKAMLSTALDRFVDGFESITKVE
jgi:hypothetical protein